MTRWVKRDHVHPSTDDVDRADGFRRADRLFLAKRTSDLVASERTTSSPDTTSSRRMPNIFQGYFPRFCLSPSENWLNVPPNPKLLYGQVHTLVAGPATRESL